MHIRTIALVLACALFALLAGCSNGKTVTKNDFNITYTGFDPHVGEDFYLKVVEVASGDKVGESVANSTVPSAGFTLNIPDIIEEGKQYNVDFFADVDGNGTADLSPDGTPAGVDHTWRLTGTGTSTGLNLTFAHDTNWTNITPF